VPAVDITAMAIQALAPHYEQPAVKAAVDSALGWLAAQDVIGAGANAQVIVALSALGEDAASYNGKDYVAALLSYYNPESGGFVYNSAAPNIMATEQAAYALVAYDRYKTSGANSLYDMGDAAKLVSDDVAPAKTDKSALAAKIAEAEGYSQGSYTAASWGILSAALANARTVYNNDNAAQGEIDAAVHGLAAAIGTLTPLGSGGSEPKYVQISVTDPNAGAGQKKEYHPLTRYEMNNNETAYTLLLRTGLNVKISTQSGYEGVYVVSIDGWGELSDGPSSGWMYSVNGEFTEVSSSLNKLKEGDVVRWVYTRNLGNDVGGGSSTGTGSAPSGGTSKVISATPAINGGTATSTVSDTQVADAIKAVLADLEGRGADAAGEVKISLDTKDAVKAVAGFTGKALKSVAKEGKVALTVETGVGALTFDSAALSAISSALSDGAKAEISISRMGGPAGGSNSSLASTLTEGQRAIVGDNPVFELSVMIDGGLVTDFGNGTVRAVLPYTPKAGEDTGRLTIYHMADDGAVTEMKGAKYDEGLGGVVFTTGHFSLFFIAAADAGLENLFNDVAAADWFYSAVKYAYENGLMNGTAAGTFSPHAKLSRAMIVRILHNIEGTEGTPAGAGGAPAEGSQAAVAEGADAAAGTADTVAEGSPAAVAEGSAGAGGAAFGDVPAGLWYSDAVAWAAANGIVTGYGNGAFGPNDDISREQLATILYNYANWKKMDTSKAAELSGYADADGISGWALNAMKWANAQGLITGRTPTELAPAGTATRAEAAAIFQRFMEGAKK
ncbi:MAG: S-layer homology domain-containing protein, partial [Clostridiales Family XIII bacterium]|jgi:hypothetical protein|nr:S-layer homology domain-containing protein [Clostridiales Family XIII bacterium]